MVHDYFTQQDIINELKAEGIYITRDILSSFAKNKYIKQIQISKKSIILYSEKDYLFLMDFFRSHTLLKESYKKIPKEYQKQFKGWISNNLINEIKTVRIRNSNLVYIENKSLAFAIDLLTNYLNSRDFGKMVYYSKCSILEKIRAGKIPALFFVGRYFIHKSEINKFR